MVFDREVGTLDFQVQRVVRANWCAAEDMSYEKLILFVGAIVTLAAFVRPSSAGLGGGGGGRFQLHDTRRGQRPGKD